ncbi:MAG TPA: VWA domain-containing protein [Bryobacteraceae bacterium]|nr:VWA domain-containing protein [Bryobacteraceae bacterium]
MLSRAFSAALFAGLAFAQNAQNPPASQPTGPPIRVQVNEVIVPVTVTDDRGRFVSNLDKNDFRIQDEGREQKIQFFSRERNQPVVVGFLLDMSNATRIHWKNFQDAAIEMALHMLPGDKKYSGYLIAYGNEAELLVNTTNDAELIVEKMRKLKPGGGAALYDAIYKACATRSLVQGEPYEPRRILIIVGDGHDTASKKTLEEVLEIAQRNLVTIYGMSTISYGFNSEGEANLVRLAEETGGRVEYPLNKLYKDVSGYLSTPSDEGNYAYKVGTGGYASEVASGLFRAVGSIAGDVTTQYIMRYIPDMGEKANTKVFRNIKVTVPSLPTVRVRARKGYYPANP